MGMGIFQNSHGKSHKFPYLDDFKAMGIPTSGFLWDSVGILTEIPSEWELKFHSHGNPGGSRFSIEYYKLNK